jgi:chromate transporter
MLAWGGPVAQIAMVREELVEREGWISKERFNRVLSVYQVLPGPEAHELCVYFGYVAHGRPGGLVAGLGFMLPGLAVMLALSWAYVRYGVAATAPPGLFYGFQAAVLALIVRAVHRIGRHALTDPWLWTIGAISAASDLAGVHFGLTLVVAGSSYASVRRGRVLWAAVLVAAESWRPYSCRDCEGSRTPR